jgi:hypothetical protein
MSSGHLAFGSPNLLPQIRRVYGAHYGWGTSAGPPGVDQAAHMTQIGKAGFLPLIP